MSLKAGRNKITKTDDVFRISFAWKKNREIT
jgi:hypothetical protein